MKSNKLRAKIVERQVTHAECANLISISPQAFSQKLNGVTKFNIEECEKLGNYLEMSDSEKVDIFLS